MSKPVTPLPACPGNGPTVNSTWLIQLTLCLAAILATVDTVVVNLGLHAIGQAFQASAAAQQWVIDSYNLVYAALLLSGGLLADYFGRRRMFLFGSGLFLVSTVLCALAPTIWLLILGRVVGGVGAALLLPASMATMRHVWQDPQRRHPVLARWAACNGAAFALGPTLGGVLIAHFGWASVFWIAVPVAIVVLGLAYRHLPESSAAGRTFDLTGQCLGIVMLTATVFAVISSHEAPRHALWALPIAFLSAAGFWCNARRKGDRALVPLSLFRNGRFSGAFLLTAAMTFAVFSLLLLMPLFWQTNDRLTSVAAGVALLPVGLAFMLLSPWNGVVSRSLGLPGTALAGSLAMAVSSAGLAWTVSLHSLLLEQAFLVLLGIGMALATAPLLNMIVSAVSAPQGGIAAALFNVARLLGATFGVALTGALFWIGGGGIAGLQNAMACSVAVQFFCLVAGSALWWRHRVTRPNKAAMCP